MFITMAILDVRYSDKNNVSLENHRSLFKSVLNRKKVLRKLPGGQQARLQHARWWELPAGQDPHGSYRYTPTGCCSHVTQRIRRSAWGGLRDSAVRRRWTTDGIFESKLDKHSEQIIPGVGSKNHERFLSRSLAKTFTIRQSSPWNPPSRFHCTFFF